MKKVQVAKWLTVSCITGGLWGEVPKSHANASRQASLEEFLFIRGEIGQYRGKLVIAQRTEPKTLNPVTAVDGTSVLELSPEGVVILIRNRAPGTKVKLAAMRAGKTITGELVLTAAR